MNTGIDAVAYATPRTFVSFDGEWAQKRSLVFTDGDAAALTAKVNRGIGLSQMAVPDAHEDIVTLAANAVRRLLEQSSIELQDVGHLIFATEGGVDFSKSASAYLLGALERIPSLAKGGPGSTSHICNVEMKFACVGSSYALEYATALLRSGMSSKKYVVVVSSDVARYERESNAEYTQGAGAVAFALCQNPSLVTLDPTPMAVASADERDFFRPLFKDTPTVDGKHSVGVYLNLVEKAYQNHCNNYFKQKLKASDSDVLADTAAFLFHVPFPKMAEYMAARIFLPFFEDVSEISEEQRNEKETDFRKSSDFRSIFEEKVEPGLTLSRKIGNIYSGSLPLCLASVLKGASETQTELVGRRVIFFGYGSGACARVYSGVFGGGCEHAGKIIGQGARGFDRELSVSEYERLHALHSLQAEPCAIDPGVDSVVKPSGEIASFGSLAEPVEKVGLRDYRYVG